MSNQSQSKELTTVEKRIMRNKELILEQLKKIPVVQVICEKTGIGRATFYRWKKEDQKFAEKADTAQREGTQLINDLAESQLLSAIKDKHMTAIIYWLKHHHPAYSTRIEVAGRIRHEHVELSPEQEELMERAINLISLPGGGDNNDN